MTTKNVLINVLKYGLGIGLFAWVIWNYWHLEADGQEVGISTIFDREVHFGFFIAACALGVSSTLLTFVRWYVLVRAQDLPFTLTSALRLGMIGYYLSCFLPGKVGGDVVKAAFLVREQSRRTVAVATVMVDRVVGLCGLFWLVALAGSIFWLTGYFDDINNVQAASEQAADLSARRILYRILQVALGLSAGSVCFWLLLGILSNAHADGLANLLERIPKLGGMLAELWRSGWIYRQRGRYVALVMLLAMVGHVGFVLSFYCCALTLTSAAELPSLGTHFLIFPVGTTFQSFLPIPSGLGAAEWAFGELYRLMGFAFPAGVLALIVYRCCEWSIALTGYFVYLRMRSDIQTARERMERHEATQDTEMLSTTQPNTASAPASNAD